MIDDAVARQRDSVLSTQRYTDSRVLVYSFECTLLRNINFLFAVKHYKFINTLADIEDSVHYPQEFLNSINPSVLPPHDLELKIGISIMLPRNLNPPNIININNTVDIIFAEHHHRSNNINWACRRTASAYLSRLQFSAKVSFALTINKSQGQTFKFVGINLSKGCISHGQLSGYLEFPPTWTFISAFQTEKRGNDKGVTATDLKYSIVVKRKSPNWRAVLSSHCVCILDSQRFVCVRWRNIMEVNLQQDFRNVGSKPYAQFCVPYNTAQYRTVAVSELLRIYSSCRTCYRNTREAMWLPAPRHPLPEPHGQHVHLTSRRLPPVMWGHVISTSHATPLDTWDGLIMTETFARARTLTDLYFPRAEGPSPLVVINSGCYQSARTWKGRRTRTSKRIMSKNVGRKTETGRERSERKYGREGTRPSIAHWTRLDVATKGTQLTSPLTIATQSNLRVPPRVCVDVIHSDSTPAVHWRRTLLVAEMLHVLQESKHDSFLMSGLGCTSSEMSTRSGEDNAIHDLPTQASQFDDTSKQGPSSVHLDQHEVEQPFLSTESTCGEIFNGPATGSSKTEAAEPSTISLILIVEFELSEDTLITSGSSKRSDLMAGLLSQSQNIDSEYSPMMSWRRLVANRCLHVAAAIRDSVCFACDSSSSHGLSEGHHAGCSRLTLIARVFSGTPAPSRPESVMLRFTWLRESFGKGPRGKQSDVESVTSMPAYSEASSRAAVEPATANIAPGISRTISGVVPRALRKHSISERENILVKYIHNLSSSAVAAAGSCIRCVTACDDFRTA
ncbi:hypothetical protein PR048_021750 [Dryococelus australis]|uniref:DNA helicase Pif1-like 2B domain-containing protein n=1 Tax=Dryococelus australis TaxID=614101 RepID=A0ABQ9GZA6_9NEOP|nr:hypothetical protein PR048_021750 [Dryococelus australis]